MPEVIRRLLWVQGYDSVLKPMEQASAHFFRTVIAPGIPTSDARYLNAPFHLLAHDF